MSNTYRTKLEWYYDSKGERDSKKWFKPSSKFKKLQKKSRKAKEREALRLEKEVIPEFPKTDVWNWN